MDNKKRWFLVWWEGGRTPAWLVRRNDNTVEAHRYVFLVWDAGRWQEILYPEHCMSDFINAEWLEELIDPSKRPSR